MDQIRARRMASEITGKKVGSWTIQDYINCGKSALVFKALQNDKVAALKVFDPELVERFGHDKQLARIEREKKLIGKRHPNLIEIYDGGQCPDTGLFYVAMAYLEHKNLSQVLDEIPRNKIPTILSQIASASKFLLDEFNLAHRDIKPENICISNDYSHATLLDLGVLRPVGLSDITDQEGQKAFVGTLRYSPPELLYRVEVDNEDGWKGITFYQLGAVLHDMIERRPIFYDTSDPYARLVDAVREKVPTFKANDISKDLVLLAKACLLKQPSLRIKIVEWEQLLGGGETNSPAGRAKRRILARISINNAAGHKKMENGSCSSQAKYLLHSLMDEYDTIIRTIVSDSKDCLPRYEIRKKTNSENSFTYTICFERSDSHCLGNHVFFTFSLEILSHAESTIVVRYKATEVDDCPQTTESSEDMMPCYTGIFDPPSLKSRISDVFLDTIDKIQCAHAPSVGIQGGSDE